MDAVDLQDKEFLAVDWLAKTWNVFRCVSPVDDNYQKCRHHYEGALQRVLAAARDNGRSANRTPPSAGLSFPEIRKQNSNRVNDWHGLSSWSIMEWACAMAGEAGELCNVAKKMHRIETGIAKKKEEIGANLLPHLAEEAADVFIYLDLLCASRGIDLEAAIKAKFNKVSEQFNFPQRL